MNEVIKVSSFGTKNDELVIDQDFIRFNQTILPRKEVTHSRYWVRLLEFYRFSVGQLYQISLRTEEKQLDIVFRCYFGIGKKYFDQLYDRMVDEIWKSTTDQIINFNIQLLLSGKTTEISGCYLHPTGLLLPQNSLFQKTDRFISWEYLHVDKKYNRLVLTDTRDPTVWSNLYYQNSWNIEALIAILGWITEEGGLAELSS